MTRAGSTCAPGLVAAAAVALGALVASPPAHAHFTLQAPDSWAQQSSLGDPQKSAPCGQADPGLAAVPTNEVTPFSPGDRITITIDETIFHPGHYRVVLSPNGMNGLPADPPVTAVGSDPCGSTVISPATFPVLADGQLQHTSPFSGPQSFQVTLPAGMTCTNCVLQVAQYMSNHALNNPGGCFYHHCAMISIQASGGSGGGSGGAGGGAGGAAGLDGGPAGTGDGGPSGGEDDGSGCGCAAAGLGATPTPIALLVAWWFGRVRRRR